MFITKHIEDTIRDTEEITSLYKKYRLVPYFGTTDESSQYSLMLIADLCSLSASHVSCKRDIASYAFGGALKGIKRPIPGVYYERSELEVQPEVQRLFFQQLMALGVTPLNLLELSKLIHSDITDAGNAYLHIRVIKVGTATKVAIQSVPYLHVMYLSPESSKDLRVLVTPKFDEGFWRIKAPLSLPVSYVGKPFVWQRRQGVTETILHIKTPNNKSDFYGLSPVIPVLDDLYAEYKSARLNSIVAGSELVGKHLLLFEEENPARTVAGSGGTPKSRRETRADKFTQKIKALREIATVEGGHNVSSSIAGIQYPYGGKKPEVITFDVNRDTEYAKFTVDKATSSIYAQHGWAKELTGQATVKAGVGANMLYDLFLVKNVATIRPLQEYYSALWADLFENLDVVLGRDPLSMTIMYPDIISDMVKTFRDADQSIFIEQGANPIDQKKQSTSMRGRSSKN